MWIEPASNVIFRSRRRAASAPATEDLSSRRNVYDDQLAANTARCIADHTQHDTEAIAATSRKNDREFMNEVSAKMANLAVNANLPPVPLHSRDATPHFRGRTPLPSAALSSSVSGYVRRDMNALTPEDNDDINAYLQRVPSASRDPLRLTPGCTPHHTAPKRAASLSPSSFVSRPSVPRWYPISTAYYGQHDTTGRPGAAAARGVNATPSFPIGHPPRPPSSDRLNAITDSVVGVARTSLYGDIVIGIPYKKQHIFNAQRELDDLDNISRSPGVNRYPTLFANSRRNSTISHFDGVPHQLNRPYTKASYAGPTGGGVFHGNRASFNRYAPQTTTGLSSTAADIKDKISMKSYPEAFVGGRSASVRSTHHPLGNLNTSRVDDFEIDALDFNDESGVIGELSSLKREAKSILSRYCLPPTTRNEPKHVMTAHELDQRYGQIVSSLQAKNRISPRSDYSTLSLPPYPSPPRKPEMSDARRKLRELLCRSRNDPHYFDS